MRIYLFNIAKDVDNKSAGGARSHQDRENRWVKMRALIKRTSYPYNVILCWVSRMHVYCCSVCKGAHSHIRGLGLDDALEPRQVRVHTSPLHTVQFLILVNYSCNELRKVAKWRRTSYSTALSNCKQVCTRKKEAHLAYNTIKFSCNTKWFITYCKESSLVMKLLCIYKIMKLLSRMQTEMNKWQRVAMENDISLLLVLVKCNG